MSIYLLFFSQAAYERLGKERWLHVDDVSNHCLPPTPTLYFLYVSRLQAAYERLGKESMTLKDALTVMKQRSAEMAVKAQVNGSVQRILVLAVPHLWGHEAAQRRDGGQGAGKLLLRRMLCAGSRMRPCRAHCTGGLRC